MIGHFGLVLGLALLIALALRGVNILLAVLLSVLVIGVTNGMAFQEIFLEYFPFGASGAFTFAGNFLLLFLCGALFGRIMAASQAAQGVAMGITRRLGAKRALLIAMLVCALLTYGGVVVFVVIFTMYPIGVTLMREANIPRRLYAAAIALGAGTFTMTALPGTPSIHNVIAARSLGTDLFAGGWFGVFAGALMAIFGMWYLERQWRLATERGEGYQATPKDEQMAAMAAATGKKLPSMGKSVLPIVLVLGMIAFPRFLLLAGVEAEWIRFTLAQPVLWASFALLSGAVLCYLLFPPVRKNFVRTAGQGADDALLPLINTAAVIGFGGVVIQTAGFHAFAGWLLELPLPPLVSVFLSANLISGITASASGGLQIFMSSLAPAYLEAGVSPEILHRVANLAAGGLDSLPHSGAVIALFTLMGLTHKEAYRDIFVVTVLVPLLAALVVVAAAMLLT
ncbi:GntP family permease [Aliidiomarina sanyensis]|uniref:Citrate transporter n=1 Tax=Aliidiomarina sanyensis TaxID=1249555 RepID=A0A432WBA3_9GAMM|nr:GntP family permease [Aliidiomarina sanyensis]RUO29064.1 citrate transporter [Aliidiomarina sanyensis]